MHANIYHALGLHMHQPPGNIESLLRENEWEAKQIILCYERPLRYMKRYEDTAKVHLGFSGILLEQLCAPQIIKKCSNILNLKRMVKEYSRAEGIEFVGMGYYHPLFPLIPMEDWELQIKRWKQQAEKLGFHTKGFWPPEMGFSMEMIPVLQKTGFDYVVVDSVHIKLLEGDLKREEITYKPHIAAYEDSEIIVIPRDRDISNAQESGFNPEWFEKEVMHKTEKCEGNCLVTTWSDGENGGWFRQMHEESGFWGYFFAPYMEKVGSGTTDIKPITISEYVKENPPESCVHVQTGAWNVANTSGYDFSQWQGSELQKKGLEEIWSVSKRFHELKKSGKLREDLQDNIEERILRAETSCNFFWGDSWVHKVYEDTKEAKRLMKRINIKENKGNING
ncbi:MAG: glycoside hydrolase family 57 [Euryarchaeota archaeon]|nr:glycoside hydrolase family 57 [Euryarchaeota archaeon]